MISSSSFATSAPRPSVFQILPDADQPQSLSFLKLLLKMFEILLLVYHPGFFINILGILFYNVHSILKNIFYKCFLSLIKCFANSVFHFTFTI